jgi:hypothetical protein
MIGIKQLRFSDAQPRVAQPLLLAGFPAVPRGLTMVYKRTY